MAKEPTTRGRFRHKDRILPIIIHEFDSKGRIESFYFETRADLGRVESDGLKYGDNIELSLSEEPNYSNYAYCGIMRMAGEPVPMCIAGIPMQNDRRKNKS